MSLFSLEHYEMLANFEREFKDCRLDKEDKSLWPKGVIFQDGHVNELFLAYRRGASYQSGIHCLKDVPAAPVRGLPLTEERADDFNGDNAALCRSIEALLSLDAAGALVPHGLGGHARGLLSAAFVRLGGGK